MDLQELKEKKLAPEWLTDEGLTTLQNGYLLEGESPKDMWRRVCFSAAKRLNKPELEDKFFELFWNNWLCGATPVLSNMGTSRGLPISCLVGDTWLNTRHSGKQIKNIEIGDELLTHEGRYKKVIAKKSRMSDNDLYKLVVTTRTTPLKITGNHPVLTNLGWVRVDELNPSIHFIATNQDIDFIEKDYVIDMSQYIDYPYVEEDNKLIKKSENKLARKNTGTVSYYAKVNKKIEVDSDLAWALGLWMAEGSKSISSKKEPNGIRITLNVKEFDLAKKWMSIINEKFNINGNFYESQSQRDDFAKGKVCRWLSCNMNSRLVGNFFTKEFGKDCKTKFIPQWILDLPKDKLKSFLDGLLVGDGHFIKENDNRSEVWVLTLANPELLLGAYNICLKLGLGCSLQMQSKASNIGKTKYVYTLRSLAPNSIKLSEFNSQSGIQFGKLRYCPIISLEKLQENEEVFDITVADDHSFSAQGVIVHNCNSIHVGDSIRSIFDKQTELAVLSKNGAGVGIYVGDVRGRGASIAGNGKSEGVIPWLKCYDSTTVAVSQGSVRRGASAVYLPVEHSDIEEFINVRRPVGDVNRRCLNLHHAVCIKDDFMQKVKDGGEHERYLWKEILKARFETGEPYLFFTDNVDKQKPECYVKNGLDIKTSNICVTGDQRVVTSDGLKTVYELYTSQEDLVLFDGQKPVKASKMHLIEKNAKVFKITTKEGRTHNLTEYHKVLTDKGLVECKNLKIGDKVKVQRQEGLFGHLHMPEMAFLLGLYHGDGTQTDDKIFIDIWENDFKLQEEIKNCIDVVYEKNNWMEYSIDGERGKFNRKAVIPNFISQQTGFSNVKKIRLGSAKLKQFGFEKNIIPDWIWRGDKETQSQYLRGLFITDGTVRISDSKKSYGNPIYLSLASISIDLLRNVQIILSNIGINSKIYKLQDRRQQLLPNGKGGQSKYDCQPAWRLNITDKNSAIIFENITKYLSYKGVKLEDRKYRDNTKKFDSIKSIEQIENQDVYCTTVESDEHVWVCNSFITSNCNEIYLYTDPDHTFVCCLSSMNLFKYDEWKNTNAVQLSIWFLDAVMQEYVDKAKGITGFESAVRFAEKSRALGLGVLGWHSLLQKKNIPFDSFQAMMLNGEIFRHMQKESQIATKDLAKEYGEPEWCKGFGIRNTHQLAVAPTVSNSIISGSVSAGIEPISANVVALKTAKGTFMRTNPILKQLLADKGMDNIDVWKQINENNGSVADLKCLNENEKEVFLTAREINQHSIIKQAGQRQKYIDQGQSVNLFFAKNSDPRYIHSVHMLAWEEGLKGLYYCRSEAALKGDSVNRQKDECKACEG